MTFHLIAHVINGQGVSNAEPSAVQDDVLTISLGTRFYVPSEYNYIHYIIARGTLFNRVLLSTPSIEAKRLRFYVFPIDKRSIIEDPLLPVFAKYTPPIELVPTEELRYVIDLAGASAAAPHVILTVLGRREIRRGSPENLLIARGTYSVNVSTPFTWVSVAPSLDVPLEAGSYRLWGAIAQAPNLVAARLLIYGQVWRPPAIALGSGDIINTTYSRDLIDEFVGIQYGEFSHMHIPQIQIMTSASGNISGQIYLFLEKLR